MSNRKKFVSKKSRILALIKEGKSIAEVAKTVGVTPGYVYHIRWVDLNKDKVKKAEKKDSRLSKAMQETTAEVQKVTRPTLTIKELEALLSPDPVNHPPHYKAGGIETIDFIEAKDLNYRLGNVIKYVSRAGKKNSDPLVDLKKARWYLDREIFAREGA
jgi:transposase-like protein